MNPHSKLKLAALIPALACISIGSRALWSRANAAGTADVTPSSLTASMILQRVANVYATAKSYQDTGVVKPASGGTAIFLSDVPFSTAYRAPDRFRFEFVAMHPVMISPPGLRGIVYRNGKDIEQWSFSKSSAAPSLDIALARATGVSSSAAHNIPALLMPHMISGRKLTNARDAKLLAEAPCDGRTCYRVQEAYSRSGITEIVWIDRSSFLIRRIDSQLTLPNNVRSDFSTLYHPVIDEPVADAALKFDAPTAGAGSTSHGTSSRGSSAALTN